LLLRSSFDVCDFEDIVDIDGNLSEYLYSTASGVAKVARPNIVVSTLNEIIKETVIADAQTPLKIGSSKKKSNNR
jgi:hypothetical protein